MKKLTVLVILLMSLIMNSFTMVHASTEVILGPEVIHKQSNHILTTSDILGMYSSSLGNIILSSDQYTGYGNIIGTYTLELYASNGSTASTKPVNIIVVQNLGNVKAVSDYKNLHVKTTQVLTPSEIVYTLENTGYVDITATTQMVIIENTYTGNEEVPGSYIFEFRLVNSAGLDQTYLSQIFVEDDALDFIPDVVFEAPPGALSSMWAWFKNLLSFAFLGLVVYVVAIKLKKKKRV